MDQLYVFKINKKENKMNTTTRMQPRQPNYGTWGTNQRHLPFSTNRGPSPGSAWSTSSWTTASQQRNEVARPARAAQVQAMQCSTVVLKDEFRAKLQELTTITVSNYFYYASISKNLSHPSLFHSNIGQSRVRESRL